MFRIVHTFAIVGAAPTLIRVEVTVRQGAPGIRTSGLAPSAARQCVERIRAAAASLSLRIPGLRITVNLAPAELPKSGASFDLPVLVGVLAGGGLVSTERLPRTALVGELGLDGSLRPVRGTLPLALACRADPRLETLIVPRENLPEVAGMPECGAIGAADLGEVLGWLAGAKELARPERVTRVPDRTHEADMSDVRGQRGAKRALEIAAVGGHHVLLSGEPGSGKSMLGHRLPGILPPLTSDEALEVSSLHSIAGCQGIGAPLVRIPPFRAPHHSVTTTALIGGGALPRPGEVSLAHRGVLFLDELAEIRPAVLDALRTPLEQGAVHLIRAGRPVTFPARFQLIAALNPCPCGYLSSASGSCTCEAWMVRRYRMRISGPLLDRFDMRVEIPRVPWELLRNPNSSGPSSQELRERVSAARQWSSARRASAGLSARSNVELIAGELRKACRLDAGARSLLGRTVRAMRLSARGCDGVLRVARSIADLERSASVRDRHVAEALHYRQWGNRPAPDLAGQERRLLAAAGQARGGRTSAGARSNPADSTVSAGGA